MWNATYDDLIRLYPERSKFYKGEEFTIKDEKITLPQSLININGHWCLERPRPTRTPEEKQQRPDRERFLIPINTSCKIQQTHLDGNPYTLFKKGKTVKTEYELTRMQQKYQESVDAVKQVDERDAICQVRTKQKGGTKIELVEGNLIPQGYMDFLEYIENLPEESNPHRALWQKLILAYKALCLLNTLHTQYNRTHGDVKLENIMINLQTRKLRFIDYETSQQGGWVRAFQGTPLYAAPEACLPNIFDETNPHIMQKDNMLYVSRMVDNFAAGVLLSLLVGIRDQWYDRADAVRAYWRILSNNPEARGDGEFFLEYQSTLTLYKNVLDKEYSCEEERDYDIEQLCNAMLDECGFPLDYQVTKLDEIILNNIISIIMHLTRFNPAQRISLETTMENLHRTIGIVQQIISQQQTVTIHIPTEPVLDKQSQSVDAANNPGTEQQSGLVSTSSFTAQSDMTT